MRGFGEGGVGAEMNITELGEGVARFREVDCARAVGERMEPDLKKGGCLVE